MIAFVGSVFSPYYALARRRGQTNPENFCALNVALYGARGHRWTMTERPAGAIRRSPDGFVVGPSSLAWEGDTLVIRIDETTVPWPSRLAGEVRVHPATLNERSFELDPAGEHRWWPIAPLATVEVALTRPALSWSGRGYLDTNTGDRPLETGFADWHWSRAALPDSTVILYDVTLLDGSSRSIAVRIPTGGRIEDIAPPAPTPLPTTFWRMRRATRTDPGATARVVSTLEDAPFYARSLLETHLLGRQVSAVHESLSLQRFSKPWVQLMLPFRMPRAFS